MADQESQISTGTKVVYVIGSLILAMGYFVFVDWKLMDIQGLDFFYLFRK
jgi:hypothetical protein